MQIRINHKGPGHPWQKSHLDLLLMHGYAEPLVFTQQEAKDYVDALSLMMGIHTKTMMWADVQVNSNMFFTYVYIPDLNQGATSEDPA